MRSVPRLLLTILLCGCALAETDSGAPVGVTETADEFVLANDVVQAHVSKASGDLTSLVYDGVETLTGTSGHPFVYWSHDVRGGVRVETSVTIDPDANGGARAEVSVKGVSGGRLMGFGPGAPPEGDLPVDVDIRYALGRGDSGIYTYSVFEHRPEYGAGDMTEARIAAKLQPWFETILVDEDRHGTFPLPIEEQDKYVYAANQHATRAYGFASEERGIGWFMIIPSAEFLSGGPTKPELLAHGPEVPTVLSYWRSSHYGGAIVDLAEGESWQRVVGPLLIYVNRGTTAQDMWDDAKRRLAREEERWPYDWVVADGYANAEERSEVIGRLVLDDCVAGAPTAFDGAVHVGLTQTPYDVTGPDGRSRTITWQQDAKHYQFWTTSSDGRFTIPNVPAGTYTLSAFADGVIAEYAQANVEVTAGGRVDLGELAWSPGRYGRTVWEIGVADRSARELAGVDDYFRPGQPLRYAEQFPNDIDFTVGASDPSTDWYYAHTSHADDPTAEVVPFSGVSGSGRAAPHTVRFRLDEAPSGRAALRIAITGTGGRPRLDVSVNGRPVEQVDFGANDAALTRHQMNGVWRSRDVVFDAALLHEGANRVTITAPAGPLNSGVVYDDVRLELSSPRCEPGDAL